MTADLAGFLRARLDEDEAAAREGDAIDVEFYGSYHDSMFGARDDDLVASRYWRRFDPARVLADVEAKRALIADLLAERREVVDGDCWFTCAAATEERDGGSCCDDTRRGLDCDCGRDYRVERRLRLLARPFRGRPGWRDEWDTGPGG